MNFDKLTDILCIAAGAVTLAAVLLTIYILKGGMI